MATALWYASRGHAELRKAELRTPKEGEALVRALWSGISRGTERLVFHGRVSPSEAGRMRAPLQDGDFPYPVKYGYCAVGVVEDGPEEWIGRTVFVLHPHQDWFVVPVSMLNAVPENVPPRRAVLGANMETALNALWDSGAGPGDRVVVVGAGVVGCLVTALAAGLPGAEVTLVDIDLSRETIAGSLGAVFAKPIDAPGEADVVIHASGTAPGLACSLACAGEETTIVEMSWYGDAMVPAPLGLDFHTRRLKLVSSQVGKIATSRRERWSHARRMAKALCLLDDSRFDALITKEISFKDAPEEFPRIFAPEAPGLATVIRYP
ncbi:zinc-dependent alcohol dehydrogenase [Microvirga massiliensis]|uniref:zinc-dependent alcohol dehydrogenase n=1 Tax=Microvirga massiliensis TaxID=1033741 RepID=UPI001FCD838B|nr:zinc-binding alcohol dehydrogenase [Microvirga massiliensis]